MKTILVIDDDDLFRETLADLLEGHGFQVVEADNGVSGLSAYNAQTIDLVVTDIIMPEKEGVETIKALKKENPDVKVVAVSGGGRGLAENYLHMARLMGARKSFSKPLNQKDFIESVNELLAQ